MKQVMLINNIFFYIFMIMNIINHYGLFGYKNNIKIT